MNLPKFRELLNQAIGDRSKSEFAKKAGIAAETLSRMLNQETISKPSRSTLAKIASASEARVSTAELCAACGYTEKDAKEDAWRASENFEAAIQTVVGTKTAAFTSIEEFAKTVQLISEVNYLVGEAVPTNTEDQLLGEFAVIVRYSAQISQKVFADCDVIVFYFQTVSGKIVINHVTDNACLAAKYGGEIAKKVLKVQQSAKQNDSDDNSKSNILYHKKNKYEPGTAEERLLKCIFGTEQYKTVHVSGMGFYIARSLPEYVFKDFLRKHKDAFCQSPTETQIYEDYISGTISTFEAFKNYRVYTNTGAGGGCWLGAVINIIYRETKGLNVQGWLRALVQEDEVVADCIVFPKMMPWEYNRMELEYTEDKLIQTLDAYAVELRAEVGPCDFDATFMM